MKKIFLGMCLFLIVCLIFVSCGANTGYDIVDLDEIVTDPVRQEPNETDYDETEIDAETEPPVELSVSDIVDEYFGTVNFHNDFEYALYNLADKKINIDEVSAISVKSIEAGRLVLAVQYKNDVNKENDELIFEGDTTAFSTFYELANNGEVEIDAILLNRNLTRESKVIENSEEHISLKEDLFDMLSDYNNAKTAIFLIDGEDVRLAEYVTVKDIIDEIFADVDFDADAKYAIETIINAKTKVLEVSESIAIDFTIAKEGRIDLIAVVHGTGDKKTENIVSHFTYSGDTTQCTMFLNMIYDFDGVVENILNEKNIFIMSIVEKKSLDANQIRTAFEELRVTYDYEKSEGLSTINDYTEFWWETSPILGNTLISPKWFTDDELLALGIEDTKAFANAVLINSKWSRLEGTIPWSITDMMSYGYDGVGAKPSWDIDDVIYVYITDFDTEDIYKTSEAKMVVVAKNGVFTHQFCVMRYIGDVTTDRHGMILSDNPNSWFVLNYPNGYDYDVKSYTFIEDIIWNNPILFDENGIRVKD